MSRRFAKSMLMILSYCAAQSYWSSTCVLRIGDAEFNQLKADLRECKADLRECKADLRECKAECASLWEKVSKLEDSTKKDHIEVEKSPKETDEQITKIYNIIMNLKDAEEAGVEVIVLNGKVLCTDSKLEYDVYKKLNEKQKKAIKLAVGCGDKVEYTNSELLLDGKIVEEYICNDQYMNLKDAEEAGVEVIVLNGKVLCADSKLEYDVYKKLDEKTKRAIKVAVGCGDKVEYTNSEWLLDGKIVEEYMYNDKYKFGGVTEAGEQILTQDEYNNSLFAAQKTFLEAHKDVVPVKRGPVVKFEEDGRVYTWSQIKRMG